MRLYFDECCSRRLASELKLLFSSDIPPLITAHVLDHYEPGTGDSNWLQPLKDDSAWIVITQDRGRDPKKEKLPVVCRQLEVTHVTLSAAIINGGYSKQKAALLAVWSGLQQLHRVPPGSHVRLVITNTKGGVERFELRIGGRPLSTSLRPPLDAN